MPVGFIETNPASEFLKMKGFCTKEPLNDKVLTSKDCINTVMDFFKTTKPIIDFINTAIEYD